MYKLLVMGVPTAANDKVFGQRPRSRTVPILETVMPVVGYPQNLVVFKIAASKFWQVRCRVAGVTHRKSSRSQSIHVARRFAREFYQQLLGEQFIEKSDQLIRSRNAINAAKARLTEQSPARAASFALDSSSDSKYIVYADHLVRNEQARVAV